MTKEKIEVIFVLAVGDVGAEMVLDAQINVLGLLAILGQIPSIKTVCFVGGKPERPEHHSTSEDAMEYFLLQTEALEDIQVEVLCQSNNTVGNITEDIVPYVGSHGITRFAILSNRYHVKRVEKILRMRGIDAMVLGSEDWVTDQKFIQKRTRSFYWLKESCKEILLRGILYIDPEYSLIRKFRVFKRRYL